VYKIERYDLIPIVCCQIHLPIIRCCILLGTIVRDFKTVVIFVAQPFILASTSKSFERRVKKLV